jgi:hypothetical protein
MIEIKDLLSKFHNALLGEEIKKETIRNILSEAINFEIKKEDIKIKNGVIYLNIKPIYKNEIYLRKDQILSELEKTLGKKSPEKII